MAEPIDKGKQDLTRQVYGQTFSAYDSRELEEFMAPLAARLEANRIGGDAFRGKRCLDAGCGGGRASVLLARLGAAPVVALDFSLLNLETARRWRDRFRLDNLEIAAGDLLSLPFPDQGFDVVWCNGVVHHTADPGRALLELARVLKVGGRLWLYLYGAGGVYWFMVDFIRDWLAGVDWQSAREYLVKEGYPAGRVAEFLDDWYVPHLKRYTHREVGPCLEALGFALSPPLAGGMAYDTSTRQQDPEERAWLGQGDLRYWVQKIRHEGQEVSPLLSREGSAFSGDRRVQSLGPVLERLARVVEGVEAREPDRVPGLRVSLAARMQKRLRDRLSRPRPFRGREFLAYLEELAAAVEDGRHGG